MSTPYKTAYPRLPDDITPKELNEHFTPSRKEYDLVKGMAKRPIPKLSALLHLKTFQRLGYFCSLDEVPPEIIDHLVQHGKFAVHPTKKQLKEYEKSGSKTRHQKEIRRYLGVQRFTSKNHGWLFDVAKSSAETKESRQDVINVMLEELVRHCFELPALGTLQKVANKARKEVNDQCFNSIASQLSPEGKTLIDELLSKKQSDSSTYSSWHSLKREPKKPTSKEVRSYLQHVNWLQELSSSMPDIKLPVIKHKQFILEARALDVSEISRLRADKRYALVAILIHSQHGKALDDLAQIFVRMVRKIERIAQAQLQKYLLEHQKQVDLLISQFRSTLAAYQQEGTEKDRINAIGQVIGEHPDSIISQCDAHMAYSGNNFLPFMLSPYKKMRSLLFGCLRVVDLQSTSSDVTTINLLNLLMSLQQSHKSQLSLEKLCSLMGCEFTTDWIPEKWKKLVLLKEKHARSYHSVDRKYLELCILTMLKDELSSGDLHIPCSSEYDDYREQLVDDETLQQERKIYAEQVGLPLETSKGFVKHLKSWLIEESRRVDQGFPSNADASIKDGRISISRRKSLAPSPEIQEIDEKLTRSLPNINIVDVLTDAEKWLGLNKLLHPHSGNEGKLSDPDKRFVATLFCYGCNLGPVQTARSLKNIDISRRQASWINTRYASEERLDKAIERVINAYNKFDLPTYWGSGKHVSADGTKWELYEQNLLSEYHIRYGGYGGIGYYHVSDTYIALFSHFIPCGVYEATYILDGLMSNKSDIRPDTLHGDTQAQSYPVFGLSYLLGINLMPRIRNIQDLSLFRPDQRFKYKNIDSLFRGAIDFKLIETHFDDMLRVAISIKLGKISASTILRRLGTYSRKNKLYGAFKELGKVVRTVFLLRYIDDSNLRKTIQSATNKSEEFNNFAKWIFFGNNGVIMENLQYEQRKIVKYNHLVANMTILHNAERMTTTLKELSDSGERITPEILAGLSPYRTSHINRYGDYSPDFRKKVKPLHYGTKILS